MEELYWSQFHSPERSLPLTDRLAEWAELNRLSGLAMTDIVTHVWPERPKLWRPLPEWCLVGESTNASTGFN